MNKSNIKILIFNKLTIYAFILLFPGQLLNSCNPSTNSSAKDKVIVRIGQAPDGINPVFSISSLSLYIGDNLYQKLLNYDYETGNLVPILADALPEVEELDTCLKVTYHIREAAVWDNKTPISAKDILFSFKLFNLLRNSAEQGYINNQQIFNIKTDSTESKTISFITVKSIRHLNITGSDMVILPEFQLDPKHLFRQYSFSEITQKADSLRKSIAFNNLITTIKEKKWHTNGGIGGSGPYKITNWDQSKGIVLEKKESWWGNNLSDANLFFNVKAPKIEFRIIKEEVAAIAQLKNKDIDAMFYIDPDNFEGLKKSKSFMNDFYLFNPNLLVYSYVGINTQNPLLTDKNTRKALACLINTQYIIEKLRNGYAQEISGPVPINSYTNTAINHYPFDVELAKRYLKQAGWKDSNQNGILDKVINGELREFIINYKFSSNPMRKAVGEMLQQEGKKVDIKINLTELSFQNFILALKNHDFDLCYDAISTDLSPVNARELYHTNSINNGHNYFYFGNKESDRIIDEMDKTLDTNQYKKLYFELQEILHDEAAHLFLICTQNPLAVRRGMGKIPTFSNYPGFWIAALDPYKVSEK